MNSHLTISAIIFTITLCLAGCRSDSPVSDGPGFTSSAGGPEGSVLPGGYAIFTPYPNPFNGTTSVEIALPVASQILLVVQNPVGDVVETLASGIHEAGLHSVQWDATRGGTRDLRAGTYFITLYAPGFTGSRTARLEK
jgi:hypothetical protein